MTLSRLSSCALALLLMSRPVAAQAPGPKLPDAPERSGPLPSFSADVSSQIKQGRFADAEATVRLYLQQNPASADGRYQLAYALMRQGKAKEALVEYTQAAVSRKPTAEELRGVAQAYVLLEDYDDADKWLTLSLQMDPRSGDTWYNLGRLRYTQNRFADAIECFQKVLALAPRSVKAEDNLGLAYEGLNRNPDAEQAYRQAIAWQEAGPPSAASEQPLLNLAILLLHGPDPAQAQPLLLRAVTIAPKDPRIREQLGQMYLRQAQFEAAAREFRAACNLDPGKSNLHFLLGRAYKSLGRQGEADAEFAESARLIRASSDRQPH